MTGPGDEQVVTFCSGLLPPSFYLAVIWYHLTGFFFFFSLLLWKSVVPVRGNLRNAFGRWNFWKREVTWPCLGGDLSLGFFLRCKPLVAGLNLDEAKSFWASQSAAGEPAGFGLSQWKSFWQMGPQRPIWFIDLIEIDMCFGLGGWI